MTSGPSEFQSSRDVIPSDCFLCRVGQVGISRGKCHHCLDVSIRPVHHTMFSCSFCKVRLQDSLFYRLSQELNYVVSCFLLIHSCSCMLGQLQVILVVVTFLCICVC